MNGAGADLAQTVTMNFLTLPRTVLVGTKLTIHCHIISDHHCRQCAGTCHPIMEATVPRLPRVLSYCSGSGLKADRKAPPHRMSTHGLWVRDSTKPISGPLRRCGCLCFAHLFPPLSAIPFRVIALLHLGDSLNGSHVYVCQRVPCKNKYC